MSIDESKPDPKTEAVKPKLADATGGEPAARAKAKPAKQPPAKPETWVDMVQTLAIALAIALVFRSFLFQPFNIPSESMKPTLLVGDFLFVSKLSYGYSRHSLPFSLPLIPGRVFFTEPKRGDVAVFKTPVDNRTDLIKRVIGLPGDDIQMIGGTLVINGTAVPRRALGPYTSTSPRTGLPTTGTLYEETLPNGATYTTLDLGQSSEDDTEVFHVPPGHYFMMGDNRDNSGDSRISPMFNGPGYVPAKNFVGKAEIFFFSIEAPRPAWAIWKWPLGIRSGRMFHAVH